MSFLKDLETELTAAGIPARRRARIVAEFRDHLSEDPGADLGNPRELARQFADELGTSLARESAFRAFAVLALAGIALLIMFFTGGQLRGWVGYAHSGTLDPVWWYAPVIVVCALAAQVALASGVLAALRAYRLRRVSVITTADAAILNRRAGVGLISGAITMTALPLTALAVHLDTRWYTVAPVVGIVMIAVLLAMLPDVLRAARLRPQRPGVAGDLTADLGPEITVTVAATPWRVAVVLSLAIFLILAAFGVSADDPYDGLLNGLLDAGACMAGFIVLGRYLGLRTSS